MNIKRDFLTTKLLIIFAAMMLTAYPVMELTRCIIEYNVLPLIAAQEKGMTIFFYTGSVGKLSSGWIPTLDGFYLELALIWGFYICIPFVLNTAINLIFRMGKQAKVKETAKAS
jgi:hypothetical protein